MDPFVIAETAGITIPEVSADSCTEDCPPVLGWPPLVVRLVVEAAEVAVDFLARSCLLDDTEGHRDPLSEWSWR